MAELTLLVQLLERADVHEMRVHDSVIFGCPVWENICDMSYMLYMIQLHVRRHNVDNDLIIWTVSIRERRSGNVRNILVGNLNINSM